MRQRLAVIGAVAVVMLTIGVVARRGSQDAGIIGPARTADGVATVASAGTGNAGVPARMQDVAPPASPPPVTQAAPGSRLEAQRLLRARDFQALTALVEAKQARVEVDVQREDELTRVVDAFNVADPTMTQLLDAWVAEHPASYVPWVVRAQHLLAIAYDFRGFKYRSETTNQQFSDMDGALQKAIADAGEALRRNPTLTHAYVMLIVMARTKGDQEACLRLAERAFTVAPASFAVRTAVAHCLLPRWGGSYGSLDAFARASQARAAENPRLKALLGFVDWDRGRVAMQDEHYDQAVAFFTRAIAAGDHWQFYDSRAEAESRQKRYTDALADVANALALRPEEPDVLVLRAQVLAALGRRREALPDVVLVSELDAKNEDLDWFRTHEIKTAVSYGHQLLESNDVDGALDRFNWGMQLAGETPDLLFWRGRAYIRKNEHERALHDFEAALRLDPRNIESYRNVDWLLAQRGRWDDIIGHWSTYIDLEPLNGEAYLERGGAYHHKGDERAAVADVRKSCGLGTQRACDLMATLR
jgi:tetratricopeptide (TPR) repeat protein